MLLLEFHEVGEEQKLCHGQRLLRLRVGMVTVEAVAGVAESEEVHFCRGSEVCQCVERSKVSVDVC